jgi:hypothetical protein
MSHLHWHRGLCRPISHLNAWSIRPSCAGGSSATISNSNKRSASAITKAAAGEAFTITQLSASQPMDSWSPRRRRFPLRTFPYLARHPIFPSRRLSTQRTCRCARSATCRTQSPRCVSGSRGLWRTHCLDVLVADSSVKRSSSRLSDAVGVSAPVLTPVTSRIQAGRHNLTSRTGLRHRTRRFHRRLTRPVTAPQAT